MKKILYKSFFQLKILITGGGTTNQQLLCPCGLKLAEDTAAPLPSDLLVWVGTINQKPAQ